MNLVALIDSQITIANNDRLLNFLTEEFTDLFQLQPFKIDDIPVVYENDWQEQSDQVKEMTEAIQEADGLIFLIPEGEKELSPALKAFIELLSTSEKTFKKKAVLVISSSHYDREGSNLQLHLRQILEEPSVGAYTFPGRDFFLGTFLEAMDEDGQVENQELMNELRDKLLKYIHFVEMMKEFEGIHEIKEREEDLYAKGSIDTTINSIDMDAKDWLEQAVEKVQAVEGNTYVKLDRGILTVNQLNYFLSSMPMELTFMDGNNQFLYYNYHLEAEEMLASTSPDQVGSPIGKLHSEAGHERVKMLIQQLRSGQRDHFSIAVPNKDPEKYVVHNYAAMKDKDGNYIGVNEYVLNIKPMIDRYLKQTNQKLIGRPAEKVDSISGASRK